MKFKLFIVLFLICLSCPAWAATYYVKNGGDDNAAGTSEGTAWATIARVAATSGYDNIVTDGDTVYFDRQGSWSGTAVVLSTTPGVVYDGTTFNTGGTQARAKLIATAAGGARDAVVSMNGTSATTTVLKGFEIDCNDIGVTGLGVGFNSSSASNILIDNCVMHNTLNAGWYYGMVVSYANSVVSNVTVQNCEGYDVAQEIFCVYNADGGSASNILFRNNILHDGGTSTTVGGYNVGFEIKNNTDGVTMEFNKIYNCHNGIHIHADGGTPVNSVIRYNLIYNTDIGINWQNTLSGNMTTNVYGNLFYGNSVAGGYASQDLRLPGNSNINIYNNTIYNANTPADGAVRIAAGGGTVNFRNNIVYTTNSPGVYDSGGYLTHSDNLIYRASGTAVYDNGSAYTSANITTWDATALGTNPSFSGGTLPTGFSGTYGSNMVPNTDYFQLTVDSPAKDTGATLEDYTGSINGAGLTTPIVRPLGAAFDIGAYEYGSVVYTGNVWSGVTIKGATCGAAGATSYCSSSTTCPGNDCAILCEDFEGSTECMDGESSNCRSAWGGDIITSVDFQNATSPAPIEGAYSVLWDAGTLGTLRPAAFTGVDNLYGYFAVNWGTIALANYDLTTIMNLQAGASPKMYIKLNKYGTGAPYKLSIACASTVQHSTATFTPDTGAVYHVFWEYEKAGGTEGATRCKAGIYSDAAKTTLLAEIEDLVGDADATITSFSFEQNDGKVDSGKFDKLKIHTSVIGGQ